MKNESPKLEKILNLFEAQEGTKLLKDKIVDNDKYEANKLMDDDF